MKVNGWALVAVAALVVIVVVLLLEPRIKMEKQESTTNDNAAKVDPPSEPPFQRFLPLTKTGLLCRTDPTDTISSSWVSLVVRPIGHQLCPRRGVWGQHRKEHAVDYST